MRPGGLRRRRGYRRPVYERVRGDPRQFVILPAHLIADVEDVVLQSDGFLIVAKREGTPKHIAVAERTQALALGLTQHPDEHRPQRQVLLGGDKAAPPADR